MDIEQNQNKNRKKKQLDPPLGKCASIWSSYG